MITALIKYRLKIIELIVQACLVPMSILFSFLSMPQVIPVCLCCQWLSCIIHLLAGSKNKNVRRKQWLVAWLITFAIAFGIYYLAIILPKPYNHVLPGHWFEWVALMLAPFWVVFLCLWYIAILNSDVDKGIAE